MILKFHIKNEKNNISRKKRIIVTFVIIILFFNFFNIITSENVIAQEEPKGILQRIGKIRAKINLILQLKTESAAAKPSAIEISYNETETFEIGMLDITRGIFTDKPEGLFDERFIKFEVIEYPGGNEHGKWLVSYNPPTVKAQEGVELKTNVSISLRSPRLAEKAIQNGILKIRIHDTWVFGSVWFPKKDGGFLKEWPPILHRPVSRWIWFPQALFGGWGKEMSGKALTDFYDVDILVRVKQFHSAAFDSVPYMTVSPNEIVSIPISLQNLGNYNDTFSFRIVSDHDDIRIAEPTSITLAPGEVDDAYLGISVSPSVFDYGTFHNIEIEAYSIDEVDRTIASRTVTLETKGVYVSEISGIGIFFFIFIIAILILFFMRRRRRLFDSICEKPDKPWEIPEEKKYLENLKKRDKEKYDEVLKMMDDEYKSALLWYDSCIISALKSKAVKKKK